jgi:predicted phage-related endonuclease
MAVTGFRGAYIAVLLGGNNFKYQFVERDEELIQMLIELESEFWDRVQANIPPELDGSDASAKFLKEHFPDSVPDSTVALPKSAIDLVEQYLVACEEIKEHEERKQEAENLLKEMLGDDEVGILDDDKVIITWKSHQQERLDTKAIKADHPTLCQRYTNTKSCRRFSVKSASDN